MMVRLRLDPADIAFPMLDWDMMSNMFTSACQACAGITSEVVETNFPNQLRLWMSNATARGYVTVTHCHLGFIHGK
jgi:hypothetical protein